MRNEVMGMKDYTIKDFLLGFAKWLAGLLVMIGLLQLIKGSLPGVYDILMTISSLAVVGLILYTLYYWIRVFWKR
ncbi:hypothetical protein [Streptococcus moroccensis]|uniref:Bacteriocin immunity protein n=1 Tax=Streptococcus moroccensis TaxID=1451356 RepID=A0ABT9YV06_9STRE|nr:hypothetical protein [Streptococcus moroccensis]MDQ0223431.1 hypothetical protein [Streptococcus moroccensis]